MKTINCWDDLRPYGIEPLTGEACGLMYRILFDVTDRGRAILAKCFGLPQFSLAEPWNQGTADEPHVGSILLAPELLTPLAVFALLEAGCVEAWAYSRCVVGIEADDSPEQVAQARQRWPVYRTFRYGGTAGDRNLHLMSGRVY